MRELTVVEIQKSINRRNNTKFPENFDGDETWLLIIEPFDVCLQTKAE